MLTCSFSVVIAEQYGVTEAILFNNIAWWVIQNETNGINLRDGRYWTYNSTKAFEKQFPFLSGYQIREALKHLIKEGLLITGNYNEDPFDKRLWYTLTEEGKTICRNSQIDDAETDTSMMRKPKIDDATTEASNTQKLDDNTYINNTDIDSIPPKENIKRKSPYVPTVKECEREFTEEVWPLYPRKQGKERAIEKYIMHRRRGTTKEEVIEGIEAYKRYIDRERVGKQFVKQGSTFFSQQAWKDDWGVAKSDLDEVFK